MYRQIETTLGIQNFRREFISKVYTLSNIKNIDNVTEKLNDVKTFNTRFNQLGEALRYCFNAAGDIAVRDKRYLETFFSAYTNPIIHKTYNYTIKAQHYARKNWDYNNNPITLTGNYVEYDVDNLGRLDFSACYAWVFVDGVLLDETSYQIINTAFGVKCYIKDAFVKNGSEVNIAINRIYNQSTQYVTTTVAKTGTSQDSILIPVSNLGTFYHPKYITIYVYRNWSDISTSTDYYYKRLEAGTYECSINTAGDTVKIDITNFNLRQGEKLFIFNSVYYWYYSNISTDGKGWTNEIDLTVKGADNITRPMPFGSIEDFDVFFNGYRLTPGLHYTLLKGGNELIPYRIKLLFNQTDTTKPFSVRIWHNEAIIDDSDCVITRDPEMHAKGLIKSKSPDLIPLMPNIGHYWLNDRSINNTYLRSRHRQVMSVDTTKTNLVTSRKNSEYRLRIVQTPALENLLSFVVDNYSEFDIVAEWIGLDVITNSIYSTLPDVTVNNTVKSVDGVFDGNGWQFYDVKTAAVEQFRVILQYYQKNSVNAPIVLDANLSPTDATYPMNIIGKLLLLDSNMAQSEVLVLDSNAFFNK